MRTFQPRRRFIVVAGGAAALPAVFATPATSKGARQMYGLIGRMIAVPGQRDALIDVLLEGIADMPGCLSYVVAKDPKDVDAIWITEVWNSPQSHRASLSLPSVQQAIARGKPLIASFGEFTETQPVGGHGLGTAR